MPGFTKIDDAYYGRRTICFYFYCYFFIQLYTHHCIRINDTHTLDILIGEANNYSCTVLAENHSPTMLNPNVALEVRLGQTYTSLMTVQVQDSDGDRVSFSLSSDSPQGLVIGASSGVLSWASVPDMSLPTTRKTAKVVITDGKVDVLWVPNIKFCKCQVRIFW